MNLSCESQAKLSHRGKQKWSTGQAVRQPVVPVPCCLMGTAKLLRWITPFIPHSTFCKVGAIITPVFLREKLGYKCINNLPKIIQLSGSANGSLLLTSV